MRVSQKVLGMVGTNCYLLIHEETKEAVLVDPADQAGRINDWIRSEGCLLRAIYLTHGHFDHILAAEELRRYHQVPVCALEAEAVLLNDPVKNLTYQTGDGFGLVPDRLLRDGEELHYAGLDCKVIATPGHTAGSCCYYFEQEQVLVSGDTLFAESVGRTDLPTGNTRQILASVRKLKDLPASVQVLPGHGESTTIGYEAQYNPYLQEGRFGW